MIEVEGLNVYFGAHRALHAVRDVSFRVAEGQCYGLVGESGSGKSTILRAISNLGVDWSGRIEINGAALDKNRTLGICRQMQLVFQDPYGSLHPRHTIDRILNEPLHIHGIGDCDRRVREALCNVGLGPEFRYRFAHQLSGGQRQRVAIARAVILEPRLLLLDEPTSALDVSVQAEVLNLLNRLRREHGLTYIIVSHDLAVVAHMCTQLAVMNKGAVVEELTSSQLRSGMVEQHYTRELIKASHGYGRDITRTAVGQPASLRTTA
ncbi:ABC transporter ATP-binding protein [Mesorhizobium sp. B2-6-5]|nr:ABC transporter ATP-binding protein [Mesorhizobium sp. B2-6-5]